MPRRKWIDKRTATHFTLVHRPQNDPLIHDDSAPSMVLNPTQPPNASKIKRLDDLASELGSEAQSVRANEGEAANYGVYFDDSEYDYMQHLRELGPGGGGAVFIESTAPQNKDKGKQKQSLADALSHMELRDRSDDLLDTDILPSRNLQRVSYQAQQDVPDSIAGFQPDMDPRLREALEALDDDAYVDEDGDIFDELTKEGREVGEFEFEQTYPDEDGWESDDTVKPGGEHDEDEAPELVDAAGRSKEGPAGDWLKDFKKFQKDQNDKEKKRAGPSHSELQSSILSTTTNGGRRKKRKGALTSQSGHSMTSSSLVRTEQMTLLDARFDKIDEDYGADMDDAGSVSAVSTSSVQGPRSVNFDSIIDEFWESHAGPQQGRNKKERQKERHQRGLAQLDEIRKGLGPAKISARKG